MSTGLTRACFALMLTASAATLCLAQGQGQKRPWKGYSILGNGRLTAVYSDDSRIAGITHARGIQHLYFKDYTADYVASTSFEVVDSGRAPRVGMQNFFTARTETSLPGGSTATLLCFVHPHDAVVLSLAVAGGSSPSPYRFQADLRKEIKTDTTVSLTGLELSGQAIVATWSNGTVLVIASRNPHDKPAVAGSSVSITGSLAGNNSKAQILLLPASSRAEALANLQAIQSDKDLEATAAEYWETWMNSGILPKFPDNTPETAAYLEAYKRNLYCVKSANLNGQIPADSTGQFVTNNMPQLYPRDAMMCARVLLLTGHAPEARQVIEYWANPRVPMKTPGEWYARYDAHGKPVASGQRNQWGNQRSRLRGFQGAVAEDAGVRAGCSVVHPGAIACFLRFAELPKWLAGRPGRLHC